MKRRKLIKYLLAHGCQLHREGSRHSIYINPVTQHKEAIPRHDEVNTFTMKKICKNLGAPVPSER